MHLQILSFYITFKSLMLQSEDSLANAQVSCRYSHDVLPLIWAALMIRFNIRRGKEH